MAQGRILAVDDDRFFRELYADILGREGYHVDVAADGKTCLAKIEENAYDLVILDLILEDTNGIALAEKIRDNDRGLELMMATKVDDLASINRALELGIREYVLKPIKEAEFLQTVASILERQRVFLEHGRLLAESVEHVYTLSIYRRCLEILGALELQPIVESVFDACMQECEAGGAIVWLRVEGEPSLYREQGRRGLVDDAEPHEFAYAEYPYHEQLLKEVPFFPRAAAKDEAQLDRNAIHVPLIRNKELLGVVKLCGKVGGRFRGKDLQTLRMLGEFTSIALANAFAVRELKLKLSRGDDFVLAEDRFAALVERERATALRYNRSFALVDFEAGEARREIEGFLQEHLRDSDAVTLVRGGCYRFFLAETDGIGARSFSRRFVAALKAKGFARQSDRPVLAQAAFPVDGEAMADLTGALERRRAGFEASLLQQLRPADFSALCADLLQRGGADDAIDKNGFLDVVQFLIADAAADPRRRAALFLGLGKLRQHHAWLDERLHALKHVRVSVFGDTADYRPAESMEHVSAIHVPSSGGETLFALYLTAESGCVALYQRDGQRNRSVLVRDEALADALILALQEQYFLQRQL